VLWGKPLHLAEMVYRAEGVLALVEGGCNTSELNKASETAL
jgi:hypothetical protein